MKKAAVEGYKRGVWLLFLLPLLVQGSRQGRASPRTVQHARSHQRQASRLGDYNVIKIGGEPLSDTWIICAAILFLRDISKTTWGA